ncbi:MAG: NAD(P)(+) transhydrogenase (Re/Si-specific) subunit alpha, partial [Actinomycetota bacterium]
RAMRAGSVIVDLAASTGGNCACTVPGGEADVDGVLILGPLHPASAMPASASDLYAANVRALVGLLAPAGALTPDWEDEILQGSVVARDGAVTSTRVAERLAGEGAS